jgi:N6-adenosine-specific RNA methylase IME4
MSHGVHSVIIAPVGRHSEKPPEARERIVQLCGDLPRVELFARSAPAGWHVWGNEVESTVDLSR